MQKTSEYYLFWLLHFTSFLNFRGTALTVNEIANLLEDEDEADPLPQISPITLIPKDHGAETDGDSDYGKTLEPKSINRFSPGILNAMAEIDFLDGDEELPDITEVGVSANFSVL